MRRPSLVVCILTLLLALASGELRAQTIKINVDFSPLWDGIRWAGDWERVPGNPEIPVLWQRILLPYGEKLETATFSPTGEERLKAGLDFVTVSFPRPMCEVKYEPHPSRAFADGEMLPDDSTAKPTDLVKHGFHLAYVPLYPVRYFPASGEGIVASGGELTLETTPVKLSPLYRGFDQDLLEILPLVDDAEFAETYPTHRAMRDMEYLVISPEEFLNDTSPASINALLAEKNRRGISTGKLTLEKIERLYTGRDLAEKVREAITYYYKINGVRYVLLVGTGYSGTPVKSLHVNIQGGTIPSDFYYACINADFEGNEDSNLACEVAVGRMPAADLTDVHAFVAKTLKMQAIRQGGPEVWKTLLFGEKMDATTLGGPSLDKLENGGSAGQISTQGYPSNAKFEKMYETHSSQYSSDEVVAALTEGNFYTINHLGHANETYCMRFDAEEIGGIHNTVPFFGITQGCHPGNLKTKNWASLLTVSSQGGAGAMVANSNYGWYEPNGDDGPSNHYHMAFYDTVFRDKIPQLGRAHYKAKEKLIPEVLSNAYIRWVVYETNLLGDPELALKF